MLPKISEDPFHMNLLADFLIPDLTYLQELSGGDIEFEIEMLETYEEEVPQHINRIEEYLEKVSWISLSEEFHSLKSKLSILGFKHIYQMADVLEEQCKNPDELNEVKHSTPDLCKMLKETLEIANKEIQKRQ